MELIITSLLATCGLLFGQIAVIVGSRLSEAFTARG